MSTSVLAILNSLIKIHIFRKRVPLFLSWNITFRCNLNCLYCASCEAPSEELSTEEIKTGLDTLWTSGTRWITFGGGEPLVRPDIGEILAYSRKKGFQTFLSTNGWLLKSRIDEIRPSLDHVNLSLDGDEEVHDLVRGAGSHAKMLEALELCKSLGLSTSLQCVLNRHNLESFTHAVDTAKAYKVPIMFQPATRNLSSSLSPNSLAPETEPYREAVEKIITLKKKGAPIRNSFAGLRHLLHWPDPQPIFCAAGRSLAILEPDGSMLACHHCQIKDFLEGSTVEGTITKKFAALSLPTNCQQCWCAPIVELCLFFSLNPEAMWNALKYK